MSCGTPAGPCVGGEEKYYEERYYLLVSFVSIFNPKKYFSSSLITADMCARELHIDKEKTFRRGNVQHFKDIFELN